MKFYITTTLPYVNAKPHIGFALEIIQADVIARCRRQKGDEVFFNTGTDEHGLKIYRKAEEEHMDIQKYCDIHAAQFDDLKTALNLSYNNFIRTTSPHHLMAAQEFWKRCHKNGDIYKRDYKIKYCVGCELEKTDSELVDNRCPIHPDLKLEIIEEENYFFRYSKYQAKLLKLYKDNPDFVLPAFRLNEIKKFTQQGLEDFSISRLKEKMPWGVPVPGDDKHVMYVWFDALVNYISAIGWPDDLDRFNAWWPAVQLAGKDNLRQQSSMWQAMLFSAGLPPSKQILIHGFINAAGQKISKSSGNLIDPFEMVKKYGTDSLRYYLLSEVKPFEDADFTQERFKQKYNADLANGLGNLVARTSNLIEKNNLNIKLKQGSYAKLKKEFDKKMTAYQFDEALKILWSKLSECDETITKTQPWKINDKDKLTKLLESLAQNILNVAELLEPFIPATSQRIIKILTAPKIKKSEALFPRLNS